MKTCADCGNPNDLRPLRLLTDPSAEWLCADVDACVTRVLQAAYWLTRRLPRPVVVHAVEYRETGALSGELICACGWSFYTARHLASEAADAHCAMAD